MFPFESARETEGGKIQRCPILLLVVGNPKGLCTHIIYTLALRISPYIKIYSVLIGSIVVPFRDYLIGSEI